MEKTGTLKFMLLVFLACGFAFLFFGWANKVATKHRIKRMMQQPPEMADNTSGSDLKVNSPQPANAGAVPSPLAREMAMN